VKTITFANAKPYVGPSKQPIAHIVIQGTQNVAVSQVLVDTGADFVQVPLSTLMAAGVSLNGASKIKVRTAAGTVKMPLVKQVSLLVEGFPVTVDLLGSPANSRPLLGRNALLALQNVGFDTVGWCW
jgi:predicted aspartyl protease